MLNKQRARKHFVLARAKLALDNADELERQATELGQQLDLLAALDAQARALRAVIARQHQTAVDLDAHPSRQRAEREQHKRSAAATRRVIGALDAVSSATPLGADVTNITMNGPVVAIVDHIETMAGQLASLLAGEARYAGAGKKSFDSAKAGGRPLEHEEDLPKLIRAEDKDGEYESRYALLKALCGRGFTLGALKNAALHIPKSELACDKRRARRAAVRLRPSR